jgi:hypothetical protein
MFHLFRVSGQETQFAVIYVLGKAKIPAGIGGDG